MDTYVWILGTMVELIRIGHPLCPVALTSEGRMEFDRLRDAGFQPSDKDIEDCMNANRVRLGLDPEEVAMSFSDTLDALKAWRDRQES